MLALFYKFSQQKSPGFPGTENQNKSLIKSFTLSKGPYKSSLFLADYIALYVVSLGSSIFTSNGRP